MRIKSIDTLRGFTISAMFAANFIKLLSSQPPTLLDHAVPQRVLPFDMIAPLFGFIMGLCLPLTIVRGRASPGRVLRRVCVLFVLGYVPNFVYRVQATGGVSIETLLTTWGILETWAVAYAAVFVISRLPRTARGPVLILLLGTYTFLVAQYPVLGDTILARKEGGSVAVLAWTFIAGTGFIVGDTLLRHPAGRFCRISSSLAAVLLAGGLTLNFWIQPMDRTAVSTSYILFSAGFSTFVFLIFWVRSLDLGDTLRVIGRWPLLAWLTQGIIYIPVNYTVGLRYFDWPTAGLLSITSLVLVLAVTERLARCGITFRV